MKKVKVCLDSKEFNVKPLKEEAALINNRLPNCVIEVNSPNSEKRFAELIGKEGHTFCPTTFKNGKRCKENFEQQQYFALDFDNKDPKHILTFDEVKKRADNYDLPIKFAYETFSSKKGGKVPSCFQK